MVINCVYLTGGLVKPNYGNVRSLDESDLTTLPWDNLSLAEVLLTVQLRCGTGVPTPLPSPGTGVGETAPGGVTVVLITLPLESHNSPSVRSTIPPATGLFPPPCVPTIAPSHLPSLGTIAHHGLLTRHGQKLPPGAILASSTHPIVASTGRATPGPLLPFCCCTQARGGSGGKATWRGEKT